MTNRSPDLTRPLVVGFGVTGQAVVSALMAHDCEPVVVDDRPSDAAASHAIELGVDLVVAPDIVLLRQSVERATVILPSPGVPASHPIFALANETATPVCSEFDLAALWDDRPLIGITGTNGKTTVTMLVTDALEASGIRSAAVGNTEIPLVQAIEDAATNVFVVEASSFRLAHSDRFSPRVAAWLNFSPDHLDAHPSLADYEIAKASIWADMPPGAVAVANAEDPVVMSHIPNGVEVVTFGLDQGDWRREGDRLVGPDGPFLDIADLPRHQPHDLVNGCAVAAIAVAMGAAIDAVAKTLRAFVGLPHRVESIGERDGVRWFNDSKATVPHATLAAVGGFDSVVLIAGGRNKGLDLAPLASAVPPVRAVIAIGDAAAEVTEIFTSLVDVHQARSMADAVALADDLAKAGDVVLLSPACTSFDSYRSYGERGDDFKFIVRELLQ